VAELLQNYQDISEEDQKKAETFFEKARVVADSGNYEYAIEMYLAGLSIDPENKDAHQAMREISLKRKASGGKDLGFIEKLRMRKGGKDDKTQMLTSEKLLAYDPGNTDHMVAIMEAAHRAGFYDTVMWIGPILERANADAKNSDFNKFIKLANTYEALEQWRLASQACYRAAQLRPDDMDLQTRVKNLGAQDTMSSGKYASGGSFRNSIRDMGRQKDLLDQDKDVRDMDVMTRAIVTAEAEYNANPYESGKLSKLVDALRRTEQEEYENRAMELLGKEYERTQQFKFRLTMGQIRLGQLTRKERQLRAAREKDKTNAALREEYKQFLRAKTEEELKEYTLWAENYPTDSGFRFEMAKRMFMLEQYNETIPLLQHVRSDPRFKVEASVLLGRAFLGAGYTSEAVEILELAIKEYAHAGDAKSTDMHYWYARALEAAKDAPQALKMYSRVAQWNFNYRDVQERIKRLRTVTE
jgi:tetratricopeptide (TPR) repeat protein